MKLKKNVKKKIRIVGILLLLIILVVGGIFAYNKFFNKEAKAVKVVDNIKEYGYELKDNKPQKYKDMFNELKDILNKDKVDEEKYASKISEMFIYDFYSLSYKTAKTDVGGVEFVYPSILNNFLENAENTYYKYVENNIYGNRKQKLPLVDEVKVSSVDQTPFTYNVTDETKGTTEEVTDEKAYEVKVTWTYTDSDYSSYQKEATLVIVHDNKKLYIAELEDE